MKLRNRGAAIVLALAFTMTGALLACGSEESKIERGLAVSPEVAAPVDEEELEKTEAEREAESGD